MVRILVGFCGGAVALSLTGLGAHYWQPPLAHAPVASNYPVRFVLPPLRKSTDLQLDYLAAAAEAAQPAELAQPTDRTDPLSTDSPPSRGVRLASDRLDFANLTFDLADFSEPSSGAVDRSSLRIRKPLDIDGAAAGDAQITIVSGSKLAIGASEFRRLLAAVGSRASIERGAGAAQDLYTFDQLRDLGFDIRYDAVSDRIQFSTTG